jgi:hypothetical protein
MCRHFDTSKAKHCRETMAEEVRDKTRANFCDWLQIRANAYLPANNTQTPQRSSLDALFGEPDSNGTNSDPKSDLRIPPNLDTDSI